MKIFLDGGPRDGLKTEITHNSGRLRLPLAGPLPPFAETAGLYAVDYVQTNRLEGDRVVYVYEKTIFLA